MQTVRLCNASLLYSRNIWIFCNEIENNVAVNQYFFHPSCLVSAIISSVVIFTVALPRIIFIRLSPAVGFTLAFFK